MNKRIDWKKGTFTVEAAVIVPMTVIIIALLAGYCFYAHQINWFRGAAYEAAAEGLKYPEGSEEKAEERILERSGSIPLSFGQESADVSSGVKLAVSYSGAVHTELFGKLFRYSGEAALRKFDPVKIKMLEFFLERFRE